MRVIINSDRLFGNFRDRLPAPLLALCEATSKRQALLVIPETALLEFNRVQADLAADEEAKLRTGYELLKGYGVDHAETDPASLVRRPDLIAMITAAGADVEVAQPLLEDFREAHHRACMHEAPQPPKSKSDEMRDLVIWMISIRQAREHGGAILLSGDVVHTHARGNEEASSVGLIRTEDLEGVLRALDVETPAGRMIRDILEAIWADLIDAGLPLSATPDLRRISNPVFVQGERGLASTRFEALLGGSQADLVSLEAMIEFEGNHITRVRVPRFAVAGEWSDEAIERQVAGRTVGSESDFEERLAALRETIGGENEPQDG